jgi:site-specific recombinase XerC
MVSQGELTANPAKGISAPKAPRSWKALLAASASVSELPAP